MATVLSEFRTNRPEKNNGLIAIFATTKVRYGRILKMRITLFNKDIYITKRWRQDLSRWSLLYRTEIVLTATGFIVGLIIGLII